MGQAVSSERLEECYFLQKVKLGQGSFGTVWRAVDRRTNDVVAVKQLDKAAMPRRGVRKEDIEREIAIMRDVSDDNVTRLLDSFEDHRAIYLALEYCDGGDFGDKVKEVGNTLQEPEAADWVRQICSAIHALHRKAICHRDIKPDNFMVHGGILKLADFGLALHLPKGKLLTEKCGTPAFMSPEQHKLPRHSRGYGHACDVWAAGISMYMLMLGGRHPFLSDRGVGKELDEQRLLQGQLDFSFSSGFFGFGIPDTRFSEQAKCFCKQMVNPDWKTRITVDAALRDPWLAQAQGGLRRRLTRKASQLKMARDDQSSPAIGVKAPHEAANANAGTSRASAAMIAVGDEIRRGMSGIMDWASDNSPSNVLGLNLNWPFTGADTQSADTVAENVSKNAPLKPDVVVREESETALQQRIRSLERQLELQRENLESQLEVMQQLNDERQALASRQSEGSSDRSMPVDKNRTSVDSAANSHTNRIDGTLKVGTKCRYNSSSWSDWMPAVVQGFNAEDGTYDLDVRPRARLENIAPSANVSASEAWPPGTIVLYQSSSMKSWLPAIIQSFNESKGNTEGTYDLDLRSSADVDRIRARLPRIVTV
mmetsp:Transcript_42830/g.118380  ORF Transcript_42830/g.118380 Transcript_42830/m.118380 type:complete len:596 (-) Transcript_42830:84-1871(-)